MRLKKTEKTHIIQNIITFSSTAQIYLFGSRVNDNERGGDIDLLIITNDNIDKIKLLATLKKFMGDQKIDIIISPPQNAVSDPFITTIMKNAELLN